MTVNKRKGGQFKNGCWRVLSESVKKGGEYIHNVCGTALKFTAPPLKVKGTSRYKRFIQVPFCPVCEKRPTGGFFNPDGSGYFTEFAP